jgi:hypothetical protein
MKTVAIICNLILFLFPCSILLFKGMPEKTGNIILMALFFFVTLLNIFLFSRSRVNYGMSAFKRDKQDESKIAVKPASFYSGMKITAIVCNLALAAYCFIELIGHNFRSQHQVMLLLEILVLFTPVVSLITIIISSPDKTISWKRTLIIAGSSLAVVIFCFILGVRTWIGSDIKKNISIARQQYPGKAEDVLIAYLLDEHNSPGDRSNVAIWTLGQIRSKKALPVLYKFYKNDPEGKTCRGRHAYVLCQYELHKSIDCIEHNYWWVSHPGLNK